MNEEDKCIDEEEKREVRGRLTLKVDIPAGTEIKDLYNDGNYYYRIGKYWFPTDFNEFRHPDFISEE